VSPTKKPAGPFLDEDTDESVHSFGVQSNGETRGEVVLVQGHTRKSCRNGVALPIHVFIVE